MADLTKVYALAKETERKARNIEATEDNSDEAYEDAYYNYAKMYKLIIDNVNNLERLQQKEKLQKDALDNELKELQRSNDVLHEKIA